MEADDSFTSAVASDCPLKNESLDNSQCYYELTTNTVDLTNSITQLGKNIFREYRSDFVLPCQTHVAITRQECSIPAEQLELVSVDLSVGFTELSLKYDPQICRRLDEHLDDDRWAEIMAQYAQSNDKELLRQLELGCHSNPELFKIKRVEKQTNKRIILNLRPQPMMRIIGVSRKGSTDTSATELTDLSDVTWCPNECDLPDQVSSIVDQPEQK